MATMLVAACAAALVGPAPPRRRTPIVPLSDHLYSYGVDKLRRETTIGTVRAVDLLCWRHVRGDPCDCGSVRRAHLFAGACGKHISGELGACTGCKRGTACRKPHPDHILSALTDWHAAAIGPPVVGTVPIVAVRAGRDGSELSRSALSALGLGGGSNCTVPAATVAERLRRHAESAPHVRRLLEQPFFGDMLASGPQRRLLAQRGSVKEISEAFAAADEIGRIAVERLGVPAEAAASGRGVTILDVCSGKGVVGHLLSRLLPEASVVMLDACTTLDLTHVAARPNLRFVELDLFSRECGGVLHELAAEHERGQVVIALGMHLCGSLSPRLLALGAHLERLDAITLCPCCIKGSLGDHVKRAAALASRPNYDVLLENLQALAARELGPRGDVAVRRDATMVSPRNGFVSVVKARAERALPLAT